MRTTTGVFFVLLLAIGGKADDKEEIAALVKELSSKNEKTRIEALYKLEALGPKAAPALKDVCDRLVDPSPKVAIAALQATKKIDPRLHEALNGYLLGATPGERNLGFERLQTMKIKARPAVTILLARWQAEFAKPVPDAQMAQKLFFTLKEIAPDDEASIQTIKSLASKRLPVADKGHSKIRGLALYLLGRWASGNEERGKEALPIVKAGIAEPKVALASISAAGDLGAAAKELLPMLKEFALSSDPNYRDAANKAIKKIDKP